MGQIDVSPRRAGTLLGAAGAIAAVTLASRITGFGRWLVFSKEIGGSCVGQAYATANQLPNVLYEVTAGGALAAVVVPLVASAVERGDRDQADRISSALLTWAVVVLLPLAVLLGLLAGPIASALAGGAGTRCEGTLSNLTATMLVVFAPQVLLYGVGIVLAGVLQAHRRFVAAAVAPLLSSLVVIAAYLVYGATGDPNRYEARPGVVLGTDDGVRWILAGGTTLGVVMLSLPLLIPLLRAGIRLRPTVRFPEGVAARARQLAGAGMIALVAQQVTVLATIALANDRGDTGAVNVYNYVQALYLLPYALLAVPIATAAFPRLSGTEGSSVLRRVLPLVGAAAILGAAALIAVSGPAGAFFEALDARPASVRALTPALAAYAPGLVGFSLIALLSRALYARGAAVAAGMAVGIGWLVAGVLPFALLHGVHLDSARTLVVLGLCSSLGMTAAAAALVALVRRDWPDLELATTIRSWVRAFLAGLLSALVGLGLGRLCAGLTDTLAGATAVSVLVGLVAMATFVGAMWTIDRPTMRGWVGALGRAGGS